MTLKKKTRQRVFFLFFPMFGDVNYVVAAAAAAAAAVGIFYMLSVVSLPPPPEKTDMGNFLSFFFWQTNLFSSCEAGKFRRVIMGGGRGGGKARNMWEKWDIIIHTHRHKKNPSFRMKF